MGDYSAVQIDPDVYTFTAGAAITGGQLVIMTGDKTVSPSTASSLAVIGVAAHDAPSGGRVSVYGLNSIHEVVVDTAGDMLAGDPVMAGALGTIKKDAAAAILKTIGICTKGATATNKAQFGPLP